MRNLQHFILLWIYESPGNPFGPWNYLIKSTSQGAFSFPPRMIFTFSSSKVPLQEVQGNRHVVEKNSVGLRFWFWKTCSCFSWCRFCKKNRLSWFVPKWNYQIYTSQCLKNGMTSLPAALYGPTVSESFSTTLTWPEMEEGMQIRHVFSTQMPACCREFNLYT